MKVRAISFNNTTNSRRCFELYFNIIQKVFIVFKVYLKQWRDLLSDVVWLKHAFIKNNGKNNVFLVFVTFISYRKNIIILSEGFFALKITTEDPCIYQIGRMKLLKSYLVIIILWSYSLKVSVIDVRPPEKDVVQSVHW